MDIAVKNLCKSYGDNIIYHGYDKVFKEGKINIIMGESGCGKTTLLNILCGNIKADSGEISGVPEKISMVFQEDRLIDDISAEDNLRLICSKKELIDSSLDELKLGEFKNTPIYELSGGMKRRVAIIRAVIADSELVIMDEPFKGLDDATRILTLDYVLEHLGDRTLILVTHNPLDFEYLKEKADIVY